MAVGQASSSYKKKKTKTRTAGKSPFSNGIVKGHNEVLLEAFSKTLEDVMCDPEIALAWAVSAKNALQSSVGFTPKSVSFWSQCEYSFNIYR